MIRNSMADLTEAELIALSEMSIAVEHLRRARDLLTSAVSRVRVERVDRQDGETIRSADMDAIAATIAGWVEIMDMEDAA